LIEQNVFQFRSSGPTCRRPAGRSLWHRNGPATGKSTNRGIENSIVRRRLCEKPIFHLSSQTPASCAHLVSVSSPPHLDPGFVRLALWRVRPPPEANIPVPFRQDDPLVPRSDRRARRCHGIRWCSHDSPSPNLLSTLLVLQVILMPSSVDIEIIPCRRWNTPTDCARLASHG
jgi:hypothetical protein